MGTSIKQGQIRRWRTGFVSRLLGYLTQDAVSVHAGGRLAVLMCECAKRIMRLTYGKSSAGSDSNKFFVPKCKSSIRLPAYYPPSRDRPSCSSI